jgi:hypothetical protein
VAGRKQSCLWSGRCGSRSPSSRCHRRAHGDNDARGRTNPNNSRDRFGSWSCKNTRRMGEFGWLCRSDDRGLRLLDREGGYGRAVRRPACLTPRMDAAIVLAEVRDGLVIGDEPPNQPHHLDVAAGLPLQPSARPHPVQVAVDVELEQDCGMIGRPAGRLGHDTVEPELTQAARPPGRVPSPRRCCRALATSVSIQTGRNGGERSSQPVSGLRRKPLICGSTSETRDAPEPPHGFVASAQKSLPFSTTCAFVKPAATSISARPLFSCPE